jgi:hypothetical protein
VIRALRKENLMKTNSGNLGSQVLAAALLTSLFLIGTIQAQTDVPIFTGKFTLTTQVQWNTTLLQPGDYTITIGSSGIPASALVRDAKGRPVARFGAGIDSGETSAGNAMLIREKGGRLRVYSLALASLGKVLVYDPVLAREAVTETRAPHTVTVMLAKR